MAHPAHKPWREEVRRSTSNKQCVSHGKETNGTNNNNITEKENGDINYHKYIRERILYTKTWKENKLGWCSEKYNEPNIPPSVRHRIAESQTTLHIGKGRVTTVEAKLLPAYFRNKRGAFRGAPGKAPCVNLAGWELLGIGFVRGLVLEAINDKCLKQRVVATLHIIRIMETQIFDINKDARKRSIKKRTTEESR